MVTVLGLGLTRLAACCDADGMTTTPAAYAVTVMLPTHTAWLTFATPTGMPDLSSDRDYAHRFATAGAARRAARAFFASPSWDAPVPVFTVAVEG